MIESKVNHFLRSYRGTKQSQVFLSHLKHLHIMPALLRLTTCFRSARLIECVTIIEIVYSIREPLYIIDMRRPIGIARVITQSCASIGSNRNADVWLHINASRFALQWTVRVWETIEPSSRLHCSRSFMNRSLSRLVLIWSTIDRYVRVLELALSKCWTVVLSSVQSSTLSVARRRHRGPPLHSVL